MTSLARCRPCVTPSSTCRRSIRGKKTPEGYDMDGLNVVWTAKLLQPARQSQSVTGGRGYYEVGLYEVEFMMMSERGRSLGTWRIRVVGYEKVREPEF